MQDYWLRQNKDKPLFPDIVWSRPENKLAAGKLLIVGGNTHGFLDVGLSYQVAVKAGAGTVRVLLPDSLRKTIGSTLENCEFAPTTPSGSFAKTALNELLINAAWADCVLLAGEFGRNSETAILLESFVQKYSGLLVLTRDAIEYFYNHPRVILDRPNTCIVGSTAQMQKLAQNSHNPTAITTSMDLIKLVEVMHSFQLSHQAYFVTNQLGTTLIAAESKVSTTITGTNEDIWRVPTATSMAVHLMQSPAKVFESLTTAIIDNTHL